MRKAISARVRMENFLKFSANDEWRDLADLHAMDEQLTERQLDERFDRSPTHYENHRRNT